MLHFRVIASVGLFALLGFSPTLHAAALGEARLADAVERQDKAQFRALLAQKADPNIAQPDGTTALHWAARLGDVEAVQLLLKAGAHAKTANRYGATPLSLAALAGNGPVIDEILKAGEDANAAITEEGDTALMAAARTGKIDAIKAFLDHGAKVNGTNPRGQTPLMWAASEKNAAAVKFLIEHGADVNAKTSALPPPKPLDLIFSAPTPAGGLSALHFAARQNDLPSVQALLDGHANVNITSADNTTALLVAVMNEHNTLAKYLLDHGADPNLADNKGRAPLYAAIDMRNLEWSTRPAPAEKDKMDDLELVQALLDHGADTNQRLTKKLPLRGQPSFDGRWADQTGATPFWRAAQSDDVTVMKMLIDHKADPTIASTDHTTPLMMAAGVGWSDGQSHGNISDAPAAIQICLDHGAEMNAQNDEGNTALHGASFRGAANVVELLAAKGARLDLKNKEGRMPINMAEGMHIGPGGWVEHEEIVALFKKLMTKPAAQQ